MSSLSPFLLRTGGPSFLPHTTTLQAGPVTLALVQGEIRSVCIGEVEILRRIYLALRGPDWRTIPTSLFGLEVASRSGSFRVAYSLEHNQSPYKFTWAVEIIGDSQGTVSFLAKGTAGGDFDTNRVGLCVLHPAALAGQAVTCLSPDGSRAEGYFPLTIDPKEPFREIQNLSHAVGNGIVLDLEFQGETFEMEDQRNWTDGSYKTYCPPADRPKPRRIAAGFETVHGVTFRVRETETGSLARLSQVADGMPLLTLEGVLPVKMPVLGFGLASHGREPSPLDIARLHVLAPGHLRAHFRLQGPIDTQAIKAIEHAAAQGRELGTGLEAALLVGEDAEGGLAAFAEAWRQHGGPVARWLIFQKAADSTPLSTLKAARTHLGSLYPEAAFAFGSKNDFVLLNRGRPEWSTPAASEAELVFSICPQVHAFDNRNILESLDGQDAVLASAQALFPGARLVVSTLSLKRTPFAASLKLPGPLPPGDWLKQSDSRQLSLFAVAWTLGSLKRMAAHGIVSATCFETTGPLGLLAGESLSAAERDFPGADYKLEPGLAFPLYHLFADWAEFRGGEVFPLRASHPLRCEGLGMRKGNRFRILAANMGNAPTALRLAGLPASVKLRRLNEKNAMQAMDNPESFRVLEGEPVSTQAGILSLDLMPFEYIRLDGSA